MFFWGGWPFLTGEISEICTRKPGMMLLIALAITMAFFASWGASLQLLSHELNFWWELALLVVIMLLGHWIGIRSLAQTTSAVDSLRPSCRMKPRKSRATVFRKSRPRTSWSAMSSSSAPVSPSPSAV